MSRHWIVDPDNRTLGVWLRRCYHDGSIDRVDMTYRIDRITDLEIDDELPDFYVEPGSLLYDELLKAKDSVDTRHEMYGCGCGDCERYW